MKMMMTMKILHCSYRCFYSIHIYNHLPHRKLKLLAQTINAAAMAVLHVVTSLTKTDSRLMRGRHKKDPGNFHLGL